MRTLKFTKEDPVYFIPSKFENIALDDRLIFEDLKEYALSYNLTLKFLPDNIEEELINFLKNVIINQEKAYDLADIEDKSKYAKTLKFSKEYTIIKYCVKEKTLFFNTLIEFIFSFFKKEVILKNEYEYYTVFLKFHPYR
jgi:hypothetical protein